MAPETALSLLGIEQGTCFEMMGQCGLRSLRYISHNIPGAQHVYYIQFNREAGLLYIAEQEGRFIMYKYTRRKGLWT